jgi:hypothetical protein
VNPINKLNHTLRGHPFCNELEAQWAEPVNSFSSEAAWSNDMKLGKKHLWKILYRDYSLRFDPFTNMAATGKLIGTK